MGKVTFEVLISVEPKESELKRFMVSEDTVPLESPKDENNQPNLEAFKIYKIDNKKTQKKKKSE
jgi:hypothetical protein